MATVADAQTVIVRNAPPGATVELLMNAASAPAVTADANGDATMAVSLPGNVAETDVHIFTESCGNIRRVMLVERGLQPPVSPQPCDRRDVFGFYVLRQVTTLVVDMERLDPAVFIRQGPAPAAWLNRGEALEQSHWKGAPAPKGLVLFAGGGFVASSGVADVVCGTLATCLANEFNGAVTLGATYWLKPFLGAQVSYMKPSDVTANGSGDHFKFNSARETRLLTLGGNVGAPVGPMKLYAHAGMNYHTATLSTTETVDDVTTTDANKVTTTVKGGTQNFELKTAGWGWLFGGGMEVWVKPWVGFYVDGARAKLKGAALGGADGSMDDQVTYVMVGARVHIGR